MDIDVSVDVDIEPTEREFISHLGGLLFVVGLLSGALYLHVPHPVLPYIAGMGVIVGIGLHLAVTDLDDDEPDHMTIPGSLGVYSAIIGIAILPVGMWAPISYEYVAGAGIALFIVGVGAVGVFEELEKDGGNEEVPDDPMSVLNGGDE